METHSFFSHHHLGDTLLPLFVICSRHTTSSSVTHADWSDPRTYSDTQGTFCCCCLETHSTSLWQHTAGTLLFIVIGNTCQNSFLLLSCCRSGALSRILAFFFFFFMQSGALSRILRILLLPVHTHGALVVQILWLLIRHALTDRLLLICRPVLSHGAPPGTNSLVC